MTWQGPLRCCENCGARIGSKTPLHPDPEVLRKARELAFEPPVDGGIRDIVIGLIANGIETFESWKAAQVIASRNPLCGLRAVRQRGCELWL